MVGVPGSFAFHAGLILVRHSAGGTSISARAAKSGLNWGMFSPVSNKSPLFLRNYMYLPSGVLTSYVLVA